MRATKFQRITALLLALLCIFGAMTVTASANTVDADESMLANIKELLNAISYNEYVQTDEEYAKAGYPKQPISIVGTSGVFVNEAGDVVSAEGNDYVLTGDAQADAENNKNFDRQKPGKFVDKTLGDKTGLYIPDTGKVDWTID